MSIRIAIVVASVLALAGCSAGSDETANDTTSTSTSAAASADPPEACATTDLEASVVSSNFGNIPITMTIALANRPTGQACVLEGEPAVRFLSGESALDNRFESGGSPSERVVLQPGERAYFDIYSDANAITQIGCATADQVAITPPGADGELLLPLGDASIPGACNYSRLLLTPMRATEAR